MNKNSTKDDLEIEKFNRIAHSWGNEEGEYKILYQINPLRVKYIFSKINKHFKIDDDKLQLDNLTVIDIGCGGGIVTTALSKLGFKVTGIDAASENIKYARENAKNSQIDIEFIEGEVGNLVELNKSYDVVVCLEVIEHINNLTQFFDDLTKILKPNGMIIISTINRTLKAFFSAIVAGEYILKWVPINTHDFKKFIKPSEIQQFLGNKNLYIKELKGLNFNLLNNDWEITQKIEVNYFAYISH